MTAETLEEERGMLTAGAYVRYTAIESGLNGLEFILSVAFNS